MAMTVLAVNAGSSTLKFARHPVVQAHVATADLVGAIEGLEPGGEPLLRWRDAAGYGSERLAGSGDADGFAQALVALQALVQDAVSGRTLLAVAHRVVHGGALHRTPVQVDDAVLQALHALSPLAPLHQPHNLEGIAVLRRVFPGVPQVACFDTAFHATLAPEEYLFALPPELARQGIRRYGFHGLSYQYVLRALQDVTARADGRIVMAHLGSGASLCAAVGGRSCATTMGFSALDGLMMGTRSGALDAGVVLHLMAQGWDHERLQQLLYRRSGLLGVSGLSADLRRLRASEEESAQLAVRMFTRRVLREAGAMAASAGGLDVLAFTGGIGEHDARLRSDVCTGLAFLGVQLDPERNEAADASQTASVHASGSPVEVWVVPTDEGRVAAQAAVDLLKANTCAG